MTKCEFKTELLADLLHQREVKGREPMTSESWYMNPWLYPLKDNLKKQAIEELIADSQICRLMRSPTWSVLLLNEY